jgi:methyltransferase (TIGR00027 family)
VTGGPSSSEDATSAAVLRDVSDTALWVAIDRARETERRHALFRDPYARRLAGERGRRIARALRRGRPTWPVVVRTAVFDELILRTVGRDGATCVLNLAAGLDTRPYRLDLPAELRWVEVDLPTILDYKAQQLGGERPRCRVERLAVDLTDGVARRRLLDRVAAAGPTLLVCEGLLVYLTHEEVAALGRDLAERDDIRWWLLDLAGPLFLQWGARTVGRQLAAARASFQSAPEEGPDFFRPLGWKPVEVRSSWEEARRLGREPWLLRLVWALSSPRRREPYRSVSRYVLLGHRYDGPLVSASS